MDEVWSAHRHDFKTCGCGAVSVDGGMDYLKRVGTDYTERSIEVPDEMVSAMEMELEWCDDTGRNNLGRVCAIFRVIRDFGYTIAPNTQCTTSTAPQQEDQE